MNIIYENLGLKKYKETWDYQLQLFNQLLENKKEGKQENNHYLLFVEHPHVFTIGRNGNINNLLINKKLLDDKDIDMFEIERGGDITYHGPGQQVVYPIFDLEQFGINIKEYVHRLEQAVIDTLKEFSILASRLEGAAGIWLDAEDTSTFHAEQSRSTLSTGKSKSRKICAIGIRSSRRVTMHGIALNINSDLQYFNYMNPCGFTDKGVTSMNKELGKEVALEEVSDILKEKILEQFDI